MIKQLRIPARPFLSHLQGFFLSFILHFHPLSVSLSHLHLQCDHTFRTISEEETEEGNEADKTEEQPISTNKKRQTLNLSGSSLGTGNKDNRRSTWNISPCKDKPKGGSMIIDMLTTQNELFSASSCPSVGMSNRRTRQSLTEKDRHIRNNANLAGGLCYRI